MHFELISTAHQIAKEATTLLGYVFVVVVVNQLTDHEWELRTQRLEILPDEGIEVLHQPFAWQADTPSAESRSIGVSASRFHQVPASATSSHSLHCSYSFDLLKSAGGNMTQLRQLWLEQGGQDIAEYAVMLAVILVLVVGTIRLVGSNANNVFSAAASSIQ
jgi:Flp pilus assembly pilin Flp